MAGSSTPQPDKVRRALVDEWLAKANEDLAVAMDLCASARPHATATAFHAQQAAEKYLKALLTRHQIEFSKTHDLQYLLDLLAQVDPQAATELDGLVNLTPYAVETRYPGPAQAVSRPEAGKAVDLAKAARDLILRRLS